MNKVKTRQNDKARNIFLILVVGLAGQLCWNIENVWFNTYVYAKVGPYSWIINVMVALSALVTTFSTFYFGTLSDRAGKRKPFIWIGYIIWGIFTIGFGTTGYLNEYFPLWIMATTIVIADCIMSFFGSMGNDSGLNAWTADLVDEKNQGSIGAVLAVLPVLGTIVGTLLGGVVIEKFGYLAFFSIIGGFVILVGLLSLILLKDKPSLEPNVRGSFWKQFGEAFSFKKLKGHKELFYLFIIAALFSIGFNVFYMHIGNLLIYNYGFTTMDSGFIQGGGMAIALLAAIPTGRAINKRKSPLMVLLGILLSVISLVFLGFIASNNDPTNLWSVTNIPLLIGVVVMATGFIIFIQTSSVWVKALYPEGYAGQFEGLRVLFFVLIPMGLSGLISEPLIQGLGKAVSIEVAPNVFMDGYAPTEVLFFAGAIIMALALIPLFRLKKEHDYRIKQTQLAALLSDEVEIDTPNTLIFDKKGNHINHGYAKDFNFVYQRKDVKKKGRLKEWDFYQVNNDRYVVQLTIGHITYIQNSALSLIDLETKTRKDINIIKLFKGKSLGLNENPHDDHEVTLKHKDYELTFRKVGKKRELYGHAVDKDNVPWKVCFELDELPLHEAMVINTPFYKSSKHFYLNYKINNLKTKGYIQIGKEKITFEEDNSFTVLDWGRGVWPLEENWYWGSLSSRLKDGREIGLNTGYGFGDLTASGENMLFLAGKAYKLNRIYQVTPMENDYTAPIHLKDDEGTVDLVLTPIYDRFNDLDLKLIFMKCHQIHCYYNGTIKLDTGEVIHLDNLLGFYEHAHNRW